MAYSNAWDITAPAGSGQVSGGDDAIRALKLDVKERVETIITGIDVQPWVLKPEVLAGAGVQVNRKVLFSPHLFNAVNDEDDIRHNDSNFEFNTTGLTGYAPLQLPNGVTIQMLEASMDRGSAANCTCDLYKINYTTGAATLIDSAVRGVAGIGVTAGGVANPPGLAEVVDILTYHYYARFSAAGFILAGPRIFAVRLTIDIPNMLSYI